MELQKWSGKYTIVGVKMCSLLPVSQLVGMEHSKGLVNPWMYTLTH